jgi:prolyl oligopeptidase
MVDLGDFIAAGTKSVLHQACFRGSHMTHFTYPNAHQDELVEDYHGTPIADPYRWLEDPFSEESQRWINAQNTLTADFLAEISARDVIKQRLIRLYDMPRRSVPTHKGNRYVFQQNSGLQDQDVIMWREGLDGQSHLLIDPNTLSEDGTSAIVQWSLDKDASLLAYAISEGGTDWQQIYIRKVDDGTDFDERLDWSKFSGVAWLPDSSGFFYSRFPAQESHDSQETAYNNKVYLHRLGTPQSEDKLVFEQPEHMDRVFGPFVTEDDTLLMLFVFEGAANKNRIYYRQLDSDGEFVKLLDENDAQYLPVGKVGTRLFIQTDLDAPNQRIVVIDLTQPEKENWHTVIAEADDPIAFTEMINHHLVVVTKHNAQNRIHIYDLDGNHIRELPLPGIGSVIGISGKNKDTEMFINFQSYLYPPTILRYDFKTNELTEWFAPRIAIDRDQYITRQVWYESKDGTRVSMFLTHRKDVEQDGNNPTILYGYGGFNAALAPGYAPHILNWLEMGGIYAVANLRGGSEYGEEWHKAGMLGNKQNVFDDFIAAAEYLIDEKYTRREKLAIMGRSNGGLLVAACMVQRPELFGAVVCVVPVTDMLRFHKFTAGRFWTGEYGNAEENADHFAFMRAYSPLHNVKNGQTYPPILITSADKDDRVVPLHAMKFTAALQAADSGNHPILLRMDVNTGHSLGKPVSRWIEEWSDIYAFLHRALALT